MTEDEAKLAEEAADRLFELSEKLEALCAELHPLCVRLNEVPDLKPVSAAVAMVGTMLASVGDALNEDMGAKDVRFPRVRGLFRAVTGTKVYRQMIREARKYEQADH